MAKTLTLAQRAKRDPALLKRVLANPGLRSKLPLSMLPPEMRRQRLLNQRLSQPVTPGSTMTERDLARESGAAADVEFGDREASERRALAEEQARTRDLGGWYDQYLAAVRQHSANVQGIGAAAATAGQGLQQGVTGLGQAGLAQIQNPANADAAARGAQANDLSGLANQALAVRQALTGSFIAQQNAANAANSNYADSVANVVAPGQKLGAMAQQSGKEAQRRQDITETAKRKGAFETEFRGQRRTEEANRVLAAQTLGAKISAEEADQAAGRATRREDRRHNKAMETAAQDRINAAKQKAIDDATAAGNKRAQSGPFAGMTQNQINGMSDEEAQRRVDDFNRKGGAEGRKKYEEDFYRKYGIQPVTTGREHEAQTSDIPAATNWLKKLSDPKRSGQKDKDGNKLKVYTLDEIGRMLTSGQGGGLPKLEAVLVRAAMDMLNPKHKGYISAGTADRLHKAGYSVKNLGLKTIPPKGKPNAPIGKPPLKP